MAGHPLRPATRHRLGRPSPHQQADRPRAHPPPEKNLSNPHHAAGAEHPVLATLSGSYPKEEGRLLTCYSPVRHSHQQCKHHWIPFDLHVLSTPPAFVLSQDQTLRKKTHNNQPTGQPSYKQNTENIPATTQPKAMWQPKQKTTHKTNKNIRNAGKWHHKNKQ